MANAAASAEAVSWWFATCILRKGIDIAIAIVMRVFFGACLSSLRIDSSIYRFLNSIHKDTADSPFNDSCRVQEWDSAHSFANIDADERQSSQMQINTLLTITYIRTRTQTCLRTNESCLSALLHYLSKCRPRFSTICATDAHLLLLVFTTTWKIGSYWNAFEPILNFKHFRILIPYHIKIETKRSVTTNISMDDVLDECIRN